MAGPAGRSATRIPLLQLRRQRAELRGCVRQIEQVVVPEDRERRVEARRIERLADDLERELDLVAEAGVSPARWRSC